MGIVAGNPPGQVTDIILTVPTGKLIKKLLNRLINRYTVRIQITHHILVPQFNPLILRVHGNARHQPLVYRTKIEIETVPLPAFHLRSQLVETKLITPSHKLIHLHHEQLLRQQAALTRKSLAGAIHILHRPANLEIIFRQAIMGTRPPHRILFGNTGTKTMPGQTNQQRMYVISRKILILLIQRTRKRSLKKHRKRMMALISRRKPLQG